MLFSFPFAFVPHSLGLLMLTLPVIGMTSGENFAESSSRPGSSTGGDDQGDRIESYWQNRCPFSVNGINE